MPALTIVASLLGIAIAVGAVLSVVHRRLRVFSGPGRPLQEHFRRLGEVATSTSCPCGSDRAYGECCRPADVEELRDDVIEYLWKSWARRSYAGRRRSDSMRHRLENHRLPRVILPDWVEQPEWFEFPIPEETLRGWSPRRP